MPDHKLSSYQFIVDKPDIILNGTGETIVEVPGRPVINLYEMGAFIHPFEFNTMCEVFGVFLHCLVALIDEYKELELCSSGTTIYWMYTHNTYIQACIHTCL